MSKEKKGLKFVAKTNKRKSIVHTLDTKCTVDPKGTLTLQMTKALEKTRKTKLCSNCMKGKTWDDLYNAEPIIKTQQELKKDLPPLPEIPKPEKTKKKTEPSPPKPKKKTEVKKPIPLAAIPEIVQPDPLFDNDILSPEPSSKSKIKKLKKSHAKDEKINYDLRDHINRLANDGDWDNAEFISKMHEFVEPVNECFNLDVPLPTIGVKKLRQTRVAQFRHERDSLGINYIIQYNELFLGSKEWFHVGTLLHEMMHLWQDMHGKPPKTRGHNKEFREKMQTFGIFVNRKGVTVDIEPGMFTDFLDQHSIDYDLANLKQDMPPEPTRIKKIKWICHCDGITINAEEGMPVNVTCNDCKSDFEEKNK